jgi:hypothetical protein
VVKCNLLPAHIVGEFLLEDARAETPGDFYCAVGRKRIDYDQLIAEGDRASEVLPDETVDSADSLPGSNNRSRRWAYHESACLRDAGRRRRYRIRNGSVTPELSSSA